MLAPRIAAALLAAFTATLATDGAWAQNSRAERKTREEEQQRIESQRAMVSRQREKQFPTKATWAAVSLSGRPFAGDRPSFVLDESFRVRGYGGCNSFTTVAYPLREQRFTVGPFAMTRKACDKSAMEMEQRFLVALRTSKQWDLVGTNLVIKTDNGELRFERQF